MIKQIKKKEEIEERKNNKATILFLSNLLITKGIYNFLDASKEKPAHPSALGFRGPSASTIQFENAGYQINNKLNSFLLEMP